MLVIRREQMDAFREASLRSFEDAMVRHLFAFAPSHSSGIGEDNVRRVVRLGLERASAYGFTNRGPVRFYLELMFQFGSYFDTDPQMPERATESLRIGTTDDQMPRADRLFGQLQDYQRAVVGPGNAYARRAVEKFRQAAAGPLPFTEETLTDGLLALMREIYPERYDYVGPAALKSVIDKGTGIAHAWSLTPVRGVALCTLLMFELGHGCFEDPLYPWISRTVRERVPADAEQSTQRLERRVLRYIDFISQHLAQE
jgi:hypothetical protein